MTEEYDHIFNRLFIGMRRVDSVVKTMIAQEGRAFDSDHKKNPRIAPGDSG
jgi:hypothetical protein